MVYVRKNQPLRAKRTFEKKTVGNGETVIVQAGTLWTVFAVEHDEAAITSVAPFPGPATVTIRISLQESFFDKDWELA